MEWIDALSELKHSGRSGVLVTILGSAGSAPRKSGSKMLVTKEHSFDTVGGGHLEFLLINKARELMSSGQTEPVMEHFPLGPKLGQCCGGSVSVILEPIAGCRFNIAVFGAGHIGKAMIHVLSPLDCQIIWIDNRPELFPQTLPINVNRVISEKPEEEVALLPEETFVLVVTHNHQLDYAIAEQTLKRSDNPWLGVIGSETKANRFRQRLEHKGFKQNQIEHMRCPVGLSNVGGRQPAEIAIAIAGEILSVKNGARNSLSGKREGIPWQALKTLLDTTPA
ncbi:xanthine dehydrogenase accessory protein XdhC [Endozoicomonas numazuensis]|uniref:Xanthine dehydrogenase n=1 Tax=Endozoicomonas numazuensis TaxID=1137799 RepID=A0A081NEA8_9GAMM|nr:xanthine dehydrogenase accessory protein XdhC [Endozoicomonas numazuensis]KEQ16781.1 xanthine dehydrogenase [Endozoicomonas numazuensis]